MVGLARQYIVTVMKWTLWKGRQRLTPAGRTKAQARDRIPSLGP
jgi:hypothetical protein